jgi:hypothetical protein
MAGDASHLNRLPEITSLHANDSQFSLWGLTFGTEPDPDVPQTKQTFVVRLSQQAGVLIFASALEAEIYCQHLAACGMPGWRRERLEQIDLAAVMAQIPQKSRRLMLSLGFYASETNDLFLDDNHTLLTPLLPVPFKMRRPLNGPPQVHISADIPAFIRYWWQRVGGLDYGEQVGSLDHWSETALSRCAADALQQVQLTGIDEYRQTWTLAGMAEGYAVYAPTLGEWQFVPARKSQTHRLH